MTNWVGLLRSEAFPKIVVGGHAGAGRNIQLLTNRGSVAARAAIARYTAQLKAAATSPNRRQIEAKFAASMKRIENKNAENNKEFRNLLAARRQGRRSPRTPSKPKTPVRPPRPQLARPSPRTKLAANIRAEIKKATNSRNSWQRQINSLQKRLEAVLRRA